MNFCLLVDTQKMWMKRTFGRVYWSNFFCCWNFCGDNFLLNFSSLQIFSVAFNRSEVQLAGFSYNFWAEIRLTQSVRWGYVNNYSTTLLLMDFLLPSFWHASRTSIYLWLLCQPHKYTAKEIWSDRKRSSESSKFMTNLRKVRSSLETSINSSIFALSRDMFLLQFDEAILREMNGANTHHMNAIEIHLLWLLLLEWDYCVRGWKFSSRGLFDELRARGWKLRKI